MADTRVLNDREIIRRLEEQRGRTNARDPIYEGVSQEFRGKAALGRLPFLIARDTGLNSPIQFWVNPQESRWQVGLRTSIEKVAGGAIHHEWPTLGIGTQPQDFLFDNPIISFTFQSGSIHPKSHIELGSQASEEITPGLGNFYDFLGILSTTNMQAGGIPNYVNILYTSKIFPSLWLQGFFTEEGVSWTDSSDNPNMVGSWGATFMVFNSFPSLGKPSEMRERFKSLNFQTS